MTTAKHEYRSPRRVLFALCLCPSLGLLACSGDEGAASESGTPGSTEPGATNGGTPAPGAAGGNSASPGVDNFDRPLGMPIGQGMSSEAPLAPSLDTPPLPDESAAVDDEVEIPVFVPPEEVAPCNGCVELNVDVSDINQRDNFVFSAGGVNVTRVVWTIIVPFNSDQLFVQPFVDSAYGTFTDLDANAFAVGTPVQLVHEYAGTASTVGLAVGSSGAWTGNMTMAVFVDSVTLEGANPAASRTFDADVGGLVVGSNTHNPQILHHP